MNRYMKKVKDHYYHKARKEGYRARSVYKLQEADARFHFLKRGSNVLDLGACPGSWSRFAAQKVGHEGVVIAVDINKMEGLGPDVIFLRRDIFKLEPAELQEILPDGSRFDVVLSDMAPKTTGNRGVDHLRSMGLAETALWFAQSLLTPGKGAFYCKVFEGGELQSFRQQCQQVFQSVKTFKPKSSRSESVEIFLFCRNRRAES